MRSQAPCVFASRSTAPKQALEISVETHEEAAEAFVWASAAVLLLMALPLALPDGRGRQAASLGALLGTLIVFGLGYRVGETGGKLVYQHGAAQAYPAQLSGSMIPGQSGAADAEDSDSE